MYRYDEFDAAFVAARVEQFRDQVARRISGELTEEQFRPHRLMNGLYLQLHAYMLRVAMPYGTLNSRQLRKLADIARKYDRGYGHFTTRQNLQFNWPALKDTPDILAELASVEMHAIQTSGNCIRNVTADHFAGVAADEIADPRPYARDPAAMVVAASRILVPAAQVQDRGQRRPARPRRDPGARHRLADRAQRRGRARLHRLCRRRPRAHAVRRQEGARLPARARSARLLRRDPARLQSRGPARQQIQGAHQDPAAREGARGPARGGRGGIRARAQDAADACREAEIARIRAYFAPPRLPAREPESPRVQRRRGKDAQLRRFRAIATSRRTRFPATPSSRFR